MTKSAAVYREQRVSARDRREGKHYHAIDNDRDQTRRRHPPATARTRGPARPEVALWRVLCVARNGRESFIYLLRIRDGRVDILARMHSFVSLQKNAGSPQMGYTDVYPPEITNQLSPSELINARTFSTPTRMNRDLFLSRGNKSATFTQSPPNRTGEVGGVETRATTTLPFPLPALLSLPPERMVPSKMPNFSPKKNTGYSWFLRQQEKLHSAPAGRAGEGPPPTLV